MENEIWKPAKGYEGWYEVSSLGNVRSVDRVIKRNGRDALLKGHAMSPFLSKGGYPSVALYTDNGRRNEYIHRLVATAFIDNPLGLPCVDHTDTDKMNNRVENLRWCTFKENSNNPLTIKHSQDAFTDEVYYKIKTAKKKNGAKNAERQVYRFTKDGEYIDTFESIAIAQRELGLVSIRQACINGYACGGYMWSFSRTPAPKYVSISERQMKKVYQYTLDGEFVKEWDSVKSAEAFYGKNGVSRATSKPNRTYSGYRWRYYKVDKLDI